MKDLVDLVAGLFPGSLRWPIVLAVIGLTVLGSALKWVGFDNIRSVLVKGLQFLRGKKMSELKITAPENRHECFERVTIKGEKAKASGEVWVIIHPKATGGYWVQPLSTDLDETTWSVLGHLGDPGNADVGKQYEIMAIIGPDEQLKVGQVLDHWPKAKHHSVVIEVVRV